MHFQVKIDNSNPLFHHIKLYNNLPIKYMYCELAIPSGLFLCLLSTLCRQPDIVTEYDKNELLHFKCKNYRKVKHFIDLQLQFYATQ